MRVVTTLPLQYDEVQQQQTIGFVPTMGFLHEGHLSLIEKAKKQCDIVVLSIFVNPLQFGPNEDFEQYPRDTERDLKLAEQAGVDIVFMPSVSVMYPKPMLTSIEVSRVSEQLCGASRPGHFSGVATVVLKLLNIVKPHKVFFGMKDAQQVAVIRTLVDDLNVDVEVVGCPTLREEDGLALSSRNVYLSPEERSQAPVLYKALSKAQAMAFSKERYTASQILDHIRADINEMPIADIDYATIAYYPSLELVNGDVVLCDAVAQSEIIIAVAVRFGRTRLIDNILLTGGDQ